MYSLHIYSTSFYLAMTQSHQCQCFLAIARDGDLSTLFHSCGFAGQEKVFKMFPGPGYLRSVAHN